MDQKSSSHLIPHEVLMRYGGITNDHKNHLYSEMDSLNLVYIPSFLRSQGSGVKRLYQYGVCQSPRDFNGQIYEYFVCPTLLNVKFSSFESEQRFCCGAPPQQYCCTSTQFSSGIHIVQSDLLISPSIFIGGSLGFLLFGIFFVIFAFSRLARNLRKASNKLFYETNASPAFRQPIQNLELNTSSDIQSNELPKKVLLSGGSRLTKVSSEKSIYENPSQNTNVISNNNHLLISDNFEGESIKKLVRQHKSRHSYKINNSGKKKRKNENSIPIKARPVLLKR
ncbi:unnamed protein product [Schistosoma rodhaini]|uniref:Shisa N-terminal domain-containing protein n=1 Tax=Schistosoma rodhaini TaxID=6188 RepID=A0AA85EKY8_9TREM|nr:unnamed protein product [Schistosoma rodhaini]